MNQNSNGEGGKPFTDVLRGLYFGRFAALCTEEQKNIVDAVRAIEKPGELTIKVTYMPNGDRSVKVTASVNAKVPKEKVGDSIFFIDHHGNLLERDPNQRTLFKDTDERSEPEEAESA